MTNETPSPNPSAPPPSSAAPSQAPATGSIHPSRPASNGLAIAALVVGIIAFLSGLAPIWGLIAGIVAIVLGVVALRKRQNKAMSIIGTVGGGIAAITSLIATIIMAVGFGAAGSGSTVADRPDTAPVQTDVASAPADSSEPAPESTPADTPAQPDTGSGAAGWADTTFGTFEAQSHSGSGDDLVTLPAGAKAGLVTATHEGSGHFAIVPLDAANASIGDLLVNTIGSYNGTTAFGLGGIGDAVTLEVKADGPWTIELAPISTASTLGAESSGSGDAVFLYDGKSGKLTATHSGSGHFAIKEETGKAFTFGLLVNEIGPYSGTVPLSAGPSVVMITADDGWTVAVA